MATTYYNIDLSEHSFERQSSDYRNLEALVCLKCLFDPRVHVILSKPLFWFFMNVPPPVQVGLLLHYSCVLKSG